MKRLSALNTWIGSIVGAIPPVMGYTAMIGHIEPGIMFANLKTSLKFENKIPLILELKLVFENSIQLSIGILLK